MIDMKESGIYCIENKVNKKKYIGKSINMHKRILKHLSKLRKNIHKNFKLQGAFNKYGESNFTHYCIEKCNELEISKKEFEYIDLYNSKHKGYNIEDREQKHSILYLKRLSYLKKNDPKHIEQIFLFRSKADNRIKINEYSLDGVYIKTWESTKDAAKFYKVSPTSISAVLRLKKPTCANKIFRYYENNINNINCFKNNKLTKIRFYNDNENIIFEMGKDAAKHFNVSRSIISVSLKKGFYKNYKLEKI